jgi:hypothetical protein
VLQDINRRVGHMRSFEEQRQQQESRVLSRQASPVPASCGSAGIPVSWPAVQMDLPPADPRPVANTKSGSMVQNVNPLFLDDDDQELFQSDGTDAFIGKLVGGGSRPHDTPAIALCAGQMLPVPPNVTISARRDSSSLTAGAADRPRSILQASTGVIRNSYNGSHIPARVSSPI